MLSNVANLCGSDQDAAAVGDPGPRSVAQRRSVTSTRDAYREARRRIDRFDRLARALDDRRQQLGMTEAELARRTQLAPGLVQRLLTVRGLNPPIGTLTAIADALELELVVRRRAD
jgi:ribosome-binding protein aMBF1 (putative translation factor)